MRHVISVFDLSVGEIEQIFRISAELKAQLAQGVRTPLLAGHVLAQVFDKPSLRTRVSFETAMAHLGGSSIFLGEEAGWGKRESIADFSRVLSQYADLVVCRTFAHSRIEELVRHATCPVINGLTDETHPCQALADLFTLQERTGPLAGKKLAFIGDGNNVARSLAIGCAKLGVHFALAAPRGYELSAAFLARVFREVPNAKVEQVPDAATAVQGASAVYTDVWTSMGQESERQQRVGKFQGFQVNEQLMSLAPKHAIFLHCLPAHRGEEVTDAVIDGPASAVVQQAGNRMHVQKGLMAWLLGVKE